MVDSLQQVTPLLLTFNEEANISRTLAGLHWATRIVVIDSGSTDRTLELLAQSVQVEVFQRTFDTHASQWNYGLAQITSPWVLSLDADYVVSGDLCRELAESLQSSQLSGVAGFRIPFRYCVFGKPLRGTVLPPRIALFQRSLAFYQDDGHTQDLVLRGPSSLLKSTIFHDDRKPLSRWLWAQDRYLRMEVAKLLSRPSTDLSFADRLRKRHVIAPFAVLFICLFWHRGLLDGWRGWFYAFQRMYVETLLSLMLWEAQHGL